MSATGLSSDAKEYRTRLESQSDDQLDAWSAELMRDMSIRLGVLPVLDEFRHSTGLDDAGVERAFAAGGGPSAVVGRTADGKMMIPAIALHYLVDGLRHESPDARERLIAYLVANFEEFVYI